MRYLVQLALVLGSAVIVILIWSVTNYHGPENLLPLLVPPMAIGWWANRSSDRRTVMVLTLTIIHYVAVSILGVLVIGY